MIPPPSDAILRTNGDSAAKGVSFQNDDPRGSSFPSSSSDPPTRTKSATGDRNNRDIRAWRVSAATVEKHRAGCGWGVVGGRLNQARLVTAGAALCHSERRCSVVKMWSRSRESSGNARAQAA